MNKKELLMAIAERTGASRKDAAEFLDAFTSTVSDALATGESVQLIGFGTFKITERAARTGKNPKTGEAIKIPKSKSPGFKAGKALKELCNAKTKKTKK